MDGPRSAARLRAVAKRDDDRLSPPSDPWAGSASVSPPTSVMPGADHVIVIERQRRRRWPWILGSIVGLTVMCCLAALVVWTPIGREYPAYLDVGHDVAGLTRSDNPDHRLASAELVARMYREENVDDAVATVLTDAKGRVVMLVGATRLIWNRPANWKRRSGAPPIATSATSPGIRIWAGTSPAPTPSTTRTSRWSCAPGWTTAASGLVSTTAPGR